MSTARKPASPEARKFLGLMEKSLELQRQGLSPVIMTFQRHQLMALMASVMMGHRHYYVTTPEVDMIIENARRLMMASEQMFADKPNRRR